MFLVGFGGMAQEDTTRHTIGLNIAQLTANTIELVYENERNARISFVLGGGYTTNYHDSWAELHHRICKVGDLYYFEEQSGGFFKLGVKYNFRNGTDKIIYPYLGLNLNNAIVFEKAEYHIPQNKALSIKIDQEHTLFVSGIGIHTGVTFRIWRFYLDAGYQLSAAIINNQELFGIFNHVPGMGALSGCNNTLRENGLISIRYII